MLAGATEYTYDNRGNLITLKDAKGNTITFEYDRNNRLTKERRPLGQTMMYQYDATGNLIRKTDAKGQKTEYEYDDAGRLITTKYFTSATDTTPAKTVDFTYNKSGNLTGYNDGTTSATYTYDDAYRKLTETVNYSSFSLGYAYTYYKNGQKKSLTMPDGTTYDYTYDNNNQVSVISISGQGFMTYSSYTWNMPSAITLPGGTKKESAYTPLMQLKSLSVKDPTQNLLMSYNYDYSPAGNITAQNSEHGSYTYQYDELYRLTEATNASSEAYTYDAVGNRLTSADVQGNWVYNGNNELLSYNGISYEYDANGNISSKTDQTGTTAYTYDVYNRLVQVRNPQSEIYNYYYDPFGKRLWKEVTGVRTNFFYSDEGLIGQYDASGNEIRSYGYAPNSTWTTNPVFQKIGTNYYWYQNDHLGTPQMITDSSGTVVWSAKYDVFGKAEIRGAAIENNLRFPGQYYDKETGLHYNYNRYYDPETGRYVTPDPVGLNGGTNLYVYAGNQPTIASDPLGLWIGWIHREITETALADAGLNCCKFAARLPDDVAGVDDEPHFQDGKHSYYHAMVDCYNPAGWAQDRMDYFDLINPRRWESCKPEYVKYALHAVQDSYAPAHKGFQPWCGGIHYVEHVSDLFKTNAAYDAGNRTRWLLEDIAKCCPQLCR